MPISFQCTQCGRSYTTTEQWAGKSVKCKQCGQTVKIPAASQAAAPAADVFGLEELGDPAGAQAASSNPLPPRTGRAEAAPASSANFARAKVSKPAGKSTASKKGFFGGAGGAFVIVVIVALRAFNAYNRSQSRQGQQQQPPPSVESQLQKFRPPALLGPTTPWSLPALPELTAGVELEPGVMLHEIQLPGKANSAQVIAGHSGKLWVYLPSGEHAPKSLGCILIAGAGSNLITGMDLGEGDRPEHLPYVKAGYAVVAYELDGRAPENTAGPAMLPYIRAFVNAEGGLLNARVALEYATTRVPAIDPRRLYAAGHSSAGTVALLVAENEPRLAGCLAYAPAVDLGVQYPPNFQHELDMLVPGAGELFTRFNPRHNEAKIQCPVFLFFAEDDARFNKQVRELADRLEAAGKRFTLQSSQTGGHYDSMIKVGVPHGIEWLKSGMN
jgi:dienelactone hydrolase